MMTPWLQASLRAQLVLVLGCAALVVLGFVSLGQPDAGVAGLGPVAVGVPHDRATAPALPTLAIASALVVALAGALLAATRRVETGRWALLAIAATTAVSRVLGGILHDDLLAAVVISAVWLALAGLLFLPSSTDWFRAAREARAQPRVPRWRA